MGPAFWDSSSLVPLCVRESATAKCQELGERYSMTVSWFAPVEVRSAISRLLRMRRITANDKVQGLAFLEIYRTDWSEVRPTEALRERAEGFLERFPLRAGDAMQLASAWNWCQGHPRSRPFISGDAQLLEAARQLGFDVIQA